MLSGMEDEIVPKEHMRALWDAVVARKGGKGEGNSLKVGGVERAKFMEFEKGGHSKCFVSTNTLFLTVAQMIRASSLDIGLRSLSSLRALVTR